MSLWTLGFGILSLVVFVLGIRIVRPTHAGVIETFGKFTKQVDAGFSWILPIVQDMHYVNITEQMVDVEPQRVITKDNLNASVDVVVYYQVKDAQASLYNVDDHRGQLTSLARTTLRAVVGLMTLTEANEKRDQINQDIEKVLDAETKSYGVEVLRVEIQKIEPPSDVQNAMNRVVKAEQEKRAAIDLAKAKETEADGERMAAIKRAEGNKQAAILSAEGEKAATILRAEANAEFIKQVNESAEKYFKGNAVELKRLETIQETLAHNTKILLPADAKGFNSIMSIVEASK